MTEQTEMLSVGIDVGTSTSQVIFSRLSVANTSGYFTVPSISITDKKIIYRGPVRETPLFDAVMIDADRLASLVERDYRDAGIRPGDVKTGAVIITGESARKENARAVLEKLSAFAGDFVVSTAGPDLEAVIAGKGSGAAAFAEQNGAVAANLDIGGGTSNAVIFDGEDEIGCGCVDIGGRQVKVGNDGRITYVSPSAARIAAAAGLELRTGDRADERTIEALCRAMCGVLETFLGLDGDRRLLEEVSTAGASRLIVPTRRPIRYLSFSGGVADCIYHPQGDPFAYGDIGPFLGRAVRESRLFSAFRVIEPEETIRATVIGAGNYTTTVSGSTITYARELFPMKNVPVLRLAPEEEQRAWEGDEALVSERLRWFMEQQDASRSILAIEGRPDPGYRELKTLAETLVRGMDRVLPQGEALIVIIRCDIAKALGQIMRQTAAGRRIVAIDAVTVQRNSYVDFGTPIMDGLVVPVVVKTLIFG